METACRRRPYSWSGPIVGPWMNILSQVQSQSLIPCIMASKWYEQAIFIAKFLKILHSHLIVAEFRVLGESKVGSYTLFHVWIVLCSISCWKIHCEFLCVTGLSQFENLTTVTSGVALKYKWRFKSCLQSFTAVLVYKHIHTFLMHVPYPITNSNYCVQKMKRTNWLLIFVILANCIHLLSPTLLATVFSSFTLLTFLVTLTLFPPRWAPQRLPTLHGETLQYCLNLSIVTYSYSITNGLWSFATSWQYRGRQMKLLCLFFFYCFYWTTQMFIEFSILTATNVVTKCPFSASIRAFAFRCSELCRHIKWMHMVGWTLLIFSLWSRWVCFQ